MFFEIADKSVRAITQANVREPRENRGRLRHCNGLQTPTATDRSPLGREGGSEVQARSQDTGLVALVRLKKLRTINYSANFSVKRRMRPACSACADRNR